MLDYPIASFANVKVFAKSLCSLLQLILFDNSEALVVCANSMTKLEIYSEA